MSKGKTTHGMSYSKEYGSYQQAKDRCQNPKSKRYKDYGGRGIEFRFANFEEFYAELGDKLFENYTLDRIDNSKHYEIGNVRWVLSDEQTRNRRTNVILKFNNESKVMCDWADEYKIPRTTFQRRIKYHGSCISCALDSNYKKENCNHRGENNE